METLTCPKCHGPREPQAVACPACGIVFGKYQAPVTAGGRNPYASSRSPCGLRLARRLPARHVPERRAAAGPLAIGLSIHEKRGASRSARRFSRARGVFLPEKASAHAHIAPADVIIRPSKPDAGVR
jgi:hypothetical protein